MFPRPLPGLFIRTRARPINATQSYTLTSGRGAIYIASYSCLTNHWSISSHETTEPAIAQLAEIADIFTPQCDVIHFLPGDLRASVLHVLATMAYQDYSRSAASVRPCECCNGAGFIDAEVFTMKTAGASQRHVREVVRVLCTECKGKRVISNACRCHGRGYSRLTFAAMLVALQRIWPELKKPPPTMKCSLFLKYW
ncbi:antitermination protein [Salmonella enterica]|nr:antitermination protein [Salmonella enterica]